VGEGRFITLYVNAAYLIKKLIIELHELSRKNLLYHHIIWCSNFFLAEYNILKSCNLMENLCMQLSSLNEGQVASVIDLLAKDGMRRRLMDLGVISGTNIKCIQKSPSGDPTAYEIRGAIIALRMEDADDILVNLLI